MSFQEVVAKPLDMGSDGELRGRRRDDLTDFLYQSLDYEQPEETEKSVATRTSSEGLQSKLKAKTYNLKQPQLDGGEIFHDSFVVMKNLATGVLEKIIICSKHSVFSL